MKIDQLNKNYKENGFCKFKGFFSKSETSKIENCITKLYYSQFSKIDDYNLLINRLKNKKNNFEVLSRIFSAMEKNDKEALYQVQKMISRSPVILNFFNKKFIELMCEFLKTKKELLMIDGPALFVNKPSSKRLLYKWHSEKHYYPKRRNFLNIWIPIFRSKNKTNGTMTFKIKSHKNQWDFVEYTGFDNSDKNKKNYFRQLEIPSSMLKKYKIHFCEGKVGDFYLFDKNLVHSSNLNKSKNYSFAIVLRVWQSSSDLSLSGDMSAYPYGGDFGRANLRVKE